MPMHLVAKGRRSRWIVFLMTILGLLSAPSRVTAVEAKGSKAITVTPTEPIIVDEATLFSFDDISIPFTQNLYRSMREPEKYAQNPVVPLGKMGEPDEWQQRYYGTVIRHEGKLKMWYIAASKEGFAKPELGGQIDFRGWRFAYAESKDGIHWDKPNLGLMEFRGSRNNNLIQMPEGFAGYHALVLHEPEEPDASRRFKMMALITRFGEYDTSGIEEYGTSGFKVAFIPFYSADGLRWRVADELTLNGKKAISPDASLVTHFEGSGLYKWKGLYYLTGQGRGSPAAEPYGRHIEIFRSPDLIHWSRTQTMGFARQGQFRRPTQGSEPSVPWNNEQTHEGVSVWNRGNVLIGITGFWHGATDWKDVTHDLGLIISNDGLHFREPLPDWTFTRIGEDGKDWDEAGLAQGQGFENIGDKTFIWYSQMDQRQGPRTGRPWKRHGGIGLLTMERDRFGSLGVREVDKAGTLITSDLKAGGPVKLWVNADGLSPQSSLRVELLDMTERPVPGYSGEHAAIVDQSGLRMPVIWKGRSQTTDLKSAFKIRVNFEGSLRGAISFYALYVSE